MGVLTGLADTGVSRVAPSSPNTGCGDVSKLPGALGLRRRSGP